MKSLNHVNQGSDKKACSVQKVIFYSFFLSILFLPSALHAQPSSHLVISEVAVGIGNAKNEFIEIYNPTSSAINLRNSGIKLKLANSSGKVTEKIITWTNEIIKPKGFFIFGTGDVGITLDAEYSSQSITGIGGALITDNNDTVIDKIAWGEKPPRTKLPPASTLELQGFEIDQPGGMNTDQSIERKAEKDSTPESMMNGKDAAVGNGWDSDNNSNDFLLQSAPYPQNFSSPEEPETEEESDPPQPQPDPPLPAPAPVPQPAHIRLSELLPDPKGDDSALEFIELENYGTSEIDLIKWSIQDAKESNTFTFTSEYCGSDSCKVPAGGFFAVYSQDYSSKSLTLNNTQGDTVRLLDPNNNIINTVSYAEKKAKENHAYALDGNNWQWTSIPTPSEKNQFDIISQNEILSKKIAPSYSREIRLNEILPNASEEYIELYNNDTQPINLSGWILRDSSKRGKYVLPENTFIPPKNFLVITKKEFRFALNNSGEESVFLYNPSEELASSLSYAGSKKDLSYSFDGFAWRWSRFLTPGSENKFSEPLKVKIKKTEHVYRDIPAFFEVDIAVSSQKEAKVTWDFGDGHKSYQFSTHHTYKNTGMYEAIVKVSAEDDFSETFFVAVEDFPEIKVKISAFSPNPKGNDTKLEWIEIKNNSKQKVNLQNWSVATGWDKLINHPIKKEFVIKSGESRKLTHKFSNFTLQNKKSRIELRYPDGEVAHAVKYKSAETVADDMVYQKEKKKKWKWIAAADTLKNKKDKNIPAEKDTAIASVAAPAKNIPPTPPAQIIPPPDENIFSEIAAKNLNSATLRESFGHSTSTEWKDKKEKTAALLDGGGVLQYASAKKRMEIINKLLSIETVRAQDEAYVFNDSTPEEHYAVRFVKNLGREINYWLGKIARKVL